MFDWLSHSIVIDCETTGLTPQCDQIIELSILRFGDGRISTWRMNPEVQISKDAFRVHRIPKEDLESEPSFSEVSREILEHFKECSVIFGYNVAFDISMLIAEFERTELGGRVFPNIPLIDARRLLPKPSPKRLQYAYQYLLRRQATHSHTSRGDVIMVKELLDCLLSSSPFAGISLDDLLRFHSSQSAW